MLFRSAQAPLQDYPIRVEGQTTLIHTSLLEPTDSITTTVRAMGTQFYHPMSRVGGKHHVYDLNNYVWHQLPDRAPPVIVGQAGVAAPRVQRELLRIRIAALEEENQLMEMENTALRRRVGVLECRLNLKYGEDRLPPYPAPCSREQAINAPDIHDNINHCRARGDEMPYLHPPTEPPKPQDELGNCVSRQFDGTWHEGVVVGVFWNKTFTRRVFRVLYGDLDQEDISWEEYVRGRKAYVRRRTAEGRRSVDGLPAARDELARLGVDIESDTPDCPRDSELVRTNKQWILGHTYVTDARRRWLREADMHQLAKCDDIIPRWGPQ